MGARDPRVDQYIAKQAEFARPILEHLRDLVHKGCPEVVETIKWGMPSLEFHGLFCGFAAFKAHCTFGFLREDVRALFDKDPKTAQAMGQFGRIGKRSDLPSDRVLLGYIRQAARLHAAGPAPKRAPAPKKRRQLEVPADLLTALAKNRKARTCFEAMSYSQQKEYIEWITEAKRDETRKRRIATALEWLAEGKSRNWKYDRC